MNKKVRKTGRKILVENKIWGLKVYLNKRGKFEILVLGRNISFGSQTEFEGINLRPKGLEVLLNSGKKSIFLFDSLSWFSTPCGKSEFKKAFLFGDVEAIADEGEQIKNYELN